MPKEKINGVSLDVQVGWIPNETASVWIVTAGGTPLRDMVHAWQNDDGDTHIDDRGRFIRSDGIGTELDRAGINRMIRMLRKARDAAYGADA